LSDAPGKPYFSSIARETGFKSDSLEKVYRMLRIIRTVNESRELRRKLALKGGTALHTLVFGMRRLSVDIDMDYIGNIDRDAMLSDREDVREQLLTTFRNMGYGTDPPWKSHAEERFDLHFINCGGGKDHLKFEVNFLNRLPLLGTSTRRLSHPFPDLDIEAWSYSSEEICAGKVRALLSRGTPRDLFDVQLIALDDSMEPEKLRKASLFYLSVTDIDARRISLAPIEAISQKDVEDNLRPMVSKNQPIDLASMKRDVVDFVARLAQLTDTEHRFFDILYDQARFEPALLFDSVLNYDGIEQHPSVKLKLRKLATAR